MRPLVIATLPLSLPGCRSHPCANAQIAEDVSPSGKLKTVTFRRDCGATTKETVQISILPSKEALPNEVGNVFVARATPTVVVHWIDDRHLTISGGHSSSAFQATKSFREVEITYE